MSQLSDYQRLVSDPLEASLRARITTLEAEAAELREKVAGLEAYAHEATKAITGLTAGGSEFFGKQIGDIFTADLPYCIEHIRDRQMRAGQRWLRSEAGRKAAEAALKEAESLLRYFTCVDLDYFTEHDQLLLDTTMADARAFLSQHSGASNAEPADSKERE